MANERYDWLARLKVVERECIALRFTADHSLRALGEGRLRLTEDVDRLDIVRGSDRLEGTYFIRLFSEFEASLQTFLIAKKLRRVPTTANGLINRVASRLKIRGPVLKHAHDVRQCRNRLVHDQPETSPGKESVLTLRLATSYLCTYLSNLPRDWDK